MNQHIVTTNTNAATYFYIKGIIKQITFECSLNTFRKDSFKIQIR